MEMLLGPIYFYFSANFFSRKADKLKTEINGKFLTGFWNVEKQPYEEIN
jgi:hypothetical protein